MKITPNNFTIGQLFTNSMEQFFIPAYQRRYAWNIKQLDALFNDINQLDENDFHLLGTVLFLTEEHKAGLNILEVVDGQQRITTISILLKVIKDYFEGSNEEEAGEIKRYLSCKDIDRKQFNKLKLGDLDNSDYEKIIINEDLEDIRNKNLLAAYAYFKEKIEGLGGKAYAFCDKLINKTLIIRLDISQAKDAYKLFETINNRGLKLTITDIIKNFLLGHASLIDDKVLTSVKNNWRSLIVNLDGLDSDGFFRHFMMGKIKIKIPKSKLAEEFKHYYYINVKEANILSDYKAHFDLLERAGDISEENDEENNGVSHDEVGQYSDKKIGILEFSKNLRDASDVYSKIENKGFDDPKINARLFDLSRIEARPSFTFLLNLFQRQVSEDEIMEIIRLIETFMLRRHVCEYRTSELDDIFSKLVGVENENIVQNVKNALKEELPSDEEFFEKFQKTKFRGLEDRAKVILEKIEYYLIKDKGEYTLKTGSDVHLEHIIPLTINTKKSVKQFGNWPQYLGKDSLEKHKDYVWRIGNLTIISQTLNIIASNNPFRAKLKEYVKSNITLNKRIIKDYTKFKFPQVDERSRELAELALKIWKF